MQKIISLLIGKSCVYQVLDLDLFAIHGIARAEGFEKKELSVVIVGSLKFSLIDWSLNESSSDDMRYRECLICELFDMLLGLIESSLLSPSSSPYCIDLYGPCFICRVELLLTVGEGEVDASGVQFSDDADLRRRVVH